MKYLDAIEKSPIGKAVRETTKGNCKVKVTMSSPGYGRVETWIGHRLFIRDADSTDFDGFRDFYPMADESK